jgi:uncharacterized protein YndB with AHSA1/START domain
MSSSQTQSQSHSTQDAITAEITINAPAARVFEALTDPRQRVQWWGSEGRFQATEMESDLRIGGAWQMRGTSVAPGGKNHPFVLRGEYTQIDPPRLLEFTWQPDWPGEGRSMVRFDLVEQTAGVTAVKVTHFAFATPDSRNKYQGWPLLLAMLRKQSEAGSSSSR